VPANAAICALGNRRFLRSTHRGSRTLGHLFREIRSLSHRESTMSTVLTDTTLQNNHYELVSSTVGPMPRSLI
jgi:hypothetical protein